jgi:hypothetical protein
MNVHTGKTILLRCFVNGGQERISEVNVTIINPKGEKLIKQVLMRNDGFGAGFEYEVPLEAVEGDWRYRCELEDGSRQINGKGIFTVSSPQHNYANNDYSESFQLPYVFSLLFSEHGQDDDDDYGKGVVAHQSIPSYQGPRTCIVCHRAEAQEMLDSLHMQWSGPTPELTNTDGASLGKAVAGINTFCTYAMSSKGACFTCHVRADGNAPHPPELGDVDCLMCHNDNYQRRFIADPDNTVTVTNINNETKTYVFGAVDEDGNYTTVPDYEKMAPGTTMLELARTVHMPTRKSCLRCHATAGGGDWTKRGDMGLSSANPSLGEDVHMSPDGADLSCAACHVTETRHSVGGRGIDLRQTEAVDPTCASCHTKSPHGDSKLNRHARGQVSCQTCHIRTFAKGGATEMSRDWRTPHWNPAFCSGQGGFVGEEIKQSDVRPEYVWFDGTSYVYNIGETIAPGEDGIYHMASANGEPFDGKSQIVPIKRHGTIMPLHENGQMVPPAIMWMFMTGDFDQAVQKGMEEQGMSGNYSLVEADAQMLISHGVEPKEHAPSCTDCHDFSGSTPDGYGMLPFTELGYHQLPAR